MFIEFKNVDTAAGTRTVVFESSQISGFDYCVNPAVEVNVCDETVATHEIKYLLNINFIGGSGCRVVCDSEDGAQQEYDRLCSLLDVARHPGD